MIKFVVITQEGGIFHAKGFEYVVDAIDYTAKLWDECAIRGHIANVD